MNVPVSAVAMPSVAPTRRTVDAFTRTLHALLGLSFTGAYLTAESERWQTVHVVLGYTLGALLLVRVLWGFVGPRPARWSALWGKLRSLGPWLAQALQGQVQWRHAQNLYLAGSIALVLAVIAPLVLSGYVNYMELAGDWMEEVHEWLGNLMLALVLAHVGGVLVLSVLRQRNLAWPMVSGRSEGPGPDLVKQDLRWLADVLGLQVHTGPSTELGGLCVRVVWPQAAAHGNAAI